jgi:hypothetical protein
MGQRIFQHKILKSQSCVQAQANALYLNLGSHFAENAPKRLKKIRQNMNVRVFSNRT